MWVRRYDELLWRAFSWLGCLTVGGVPVECGLVRSGEGAHYRGAGAQEIFRSRRGRLLLRA